MTQTAATTSSAAASESAVAGSPAAAGHGDPTSHNTASHNTASHAHPSDWQYIKIALLLAVLTAIEVFTYFESVHNLSDAALIAALTVLMVLKFFYVAAWFMHLKFDSVIYTRIFQVGLVIAILVYLAMLTAFEIW